MGPTRDNWLERWKRYFDSLSSDLALKKYYNRDIVDITYNMLLNFWGKDFFEFDVIEAIQKNELHFIQSLVFRPTDASFYRLVEACLMIEFAYVQSPEQYKRLLSFKDRSESVKDTLCELLVEYSFKEAGIEYTANAKRGAQTLEGYGQLNGEQILVECKNKYSMNQSEFKVICYITARLMAIGNKMTNQNLGVGYIYFKNRSITEHQTYKVIKEIEHYLLHNTKIHLFGEFEDENLRVELKPGTKDNYHEFDNGVIQSNLNFSVKHTYQFDSKDNLIYNMHVGHRSSARRSELTKRLKRTLDNARTQHKSDSSRIRVFCIFNEFLNDFRPPLLVDSADFIPDVAKYLSSKNTDDIVILIDRRFNSKEAFIQTHIIGNDHLVEFKKSLSTIDFSIRNLLKNLN